MNWSKTLIAGVASGIALTAFEFLVHGQIMANTYSELGIFADDGSPFHFVLVAVCVATAAAVLFAKTRASWSNGAGGGVTYGFYLGLIMFFAAFYRPLVYEGFPYYLAWCQGSINLIAVMVMGAVQGLIVKK